MNKKILALIIGLMVVLISCTTPQEDKIKIGVALPLTGAWAVGGEAAYKGILIAQEEINSQGGINGVPVELIVEDTKSSVPDAVTAVQKLVNIDKAPIIIAGALSAEAVGVAPVAQEAKVVLLSPLALTSTVDKAGEWFFKLRESTAIHAETTLKQAAKKGHKKLGIISQRYEACDDLLNKMELYYNELGITVLITERYEAKDTDMRTQLLKLKEANPDAWYACGLYQDIGLVFKQAKEIGFNKPIFTMVAAENKKLFEIAGDAAEGAVFTSTKWSCEHAQEFCQKFKEKHNTEPDYRSAFGYDSLKLVAEAIKRKGTSSEQIKEGLLSIQDYYGAGGKTAFDKEGNAEKEVIVKQVKGQKFVVVE